MGAAEVVELVVGVVELVELVVGVVELGELAIRVVKLLELVVRAVELVELVELVGRVDFAWCSTLNPDISSDECKGAFGYCLL